MGHKFFNKIVFFILLIGTPIFGQENSELDFFLIDSYVTPEKPHTFKLTFFTSADVKTEVKIGDKYIVNVSDDYLEDHSANIDFSEYTFNVKNVPFQIIASDRKGKKYFSEVFELTLPYEEFIETKEGAEPISTLLFGMLLYLLPSPNLAIVDNENYFGITKEIPIITFYSSGYNYPSATVTLEYSHIYKINNGDFLRLGYKQIFPIKVFEYISPGITTFTNFNGFNGMAAELTIGLFNVYDVFTVYSRYRYNIKPSNFSDDFHEISVGLFSHFFTIDF